MGSTVEIREVKEIKPGDWIVLETIQLVKAIHGTVIELVNGLTLAPPPDQKLLVVKGL